MSTEQSAFSSLPHPLEDEVKMVYQQTCTAYQNIEDFRTKLLSFLPLVTGSSFVITIISDPTKNRALLNLVLPFGFLGAILTLGYLCYEIEHIRRQEALRTSGELLEKKMALPSQTGFFGQLPSPSSSGFFTDIHAAEFIYCTTIAAWVCIGLWFVLPGRAIIIATILLLLLLAITLPVMNMIRKSFRKIARGIAHA